MGKVIIVGAGFSGSIIARKIAEDMDREVEIIERRSHIGGNAYDEYDEKTGILVQKYGPHFLNTNKFFIIKFLMRFAELFPHETKLLSFIDGNYVRLPFNFKTMQQLVGAEKAESLLAKMRKEYPGADRIPILKLVDSEDKDISEYAQLLFEKAYKTYISKMWGVGVDTIDKYVLERVPMAMNYDERYLNKDFQYLPKNGFIEIFRNMLDHPNIKLTLNEDALKHITFDEANRRVLYDNKTVECLVFTGPIDELFGLKYGDLPYRSLDIRYQYSEQNSVLPGEIVSYPQADGYTRSTEYRKIMFDDSHISGSIVATEYPLQYDRNAEIGNTPYYPVVTEESNKIYRRYLDEVKKYNNIFLCGRLAEFKYYNMDICIEHALEYAENIKDYLKNAQ
ncbi:MAG: UDP-galactopyranose mutase [Oscillospiraceae bacterium]|nr:UDP-galactopyranose mutase [Oscillospiraceae bacterium]